MDPLTGTACEIARRMDPEAAVLRLNTSLATLDKHIRAMHIARAQLEDKKRSLLEFMAPLEAEIVCEF